MPFKTTSTWDTKEHRIEVGQLASVVAFFDQQLADNTVVDLPYTIDDVTTERTWTTQDVAQQWIDLVTAEATSKGYTVTFVLEEVTG